MTDPDSGRLPVIVGNGTPQVVLFRSCEIHCQDEIDVTDDGTFRFSGYKITFTRLDAGEGVKYVDVDQLHRERAKAVAFLRKIDDEDREGCMTPCHYPMGTYCDDCLTEFLDRLDAGEL